MQSNTILGCRFLKLTLSPRDFYYSFIMWCMPRHTYSGQDNLWTWLSLSFCHGGPRVWTDMLSVLTANTKMDFASLLVWVWLFFLFNFKLLLLFCVPEVDTCMSLNMQRWEDTEEVSFLNPPCGPRGWIQIIRVGMSLNSFKSTWE